MHSALKVDMEIVVAVAVVAAFFVVVGAAAVKNAGMKRDMKLESPGECRG